MPKLIRDGGGPPQVSPETAGDLVHAELEKIVASPGFATSDRHIRLLRYLVSMALEGRGAEVKEYVLAVDLLGRSPSFDPQADAIVRTELSRLRGKLKAYYGDTQGNRVRIELPSRSYVPVFNFAEKPPAKAAPGRWRLRYVSAFVIASLLVLFGGLSWLSPIGVLGMRRAETGDMTSVAVLPFVNADADPGLEHFADGLTEEIIETLAEIGGVRVISRSSVFQLKGKQENVRAVAGRLNVGAVLEGDVRRSGNRLRIGARLINAAEGYEYYSHVYEHDVDDATNLQREIARDAAGVLHVREEGKEVARFTNSAEANRLYLEGLYHSSSPSESELKRAVVCYQRAIACDRNYSPAYASLSEAYVSLALLNEAPAQAMEQAVEAARVAVRTGATYAHAHAALGSVLALHDWNWAAAEKEFRKALDADPEDSAILQQYAMRCLAPQGHLDSALFELQLAQQIDPLSPQVALQRGKVLYFSRDPGHALREIQAALALDPQLETVPLAMAQVYMESSSFQEALKTLQGSSVATEDEARLAALGTLYGLSRQPDRAREVLRRLAAIEDHQPISGYYLAQVHLALGETQAALDCLEKSAAGHDPLIGYIRVDPDFDSLWTESRFQALLTKVGLDHAP